MNGESWGLVIAISLILIGIILQQMGLHNMKARIDRVQADLSQFYRTLGQHRM